MIWDDDDPARKRAESARIAADEESRKASTALAKGIRYAVDRGPG
ncbi:hypothetical protein AB0C18_43130 [Nonomuraea muscovyensis]